MKQKKAPTDVSLIMRKPYVEQAGWAIITKKFINELSDYLLSKNYSCLEIMAGKGVISAGLKEKGVNVIATDNLSWSQHINSGNGFWTEVEDLDAVSAIRKYRDVNVIIASWMPMYIPYKNIIRAIRKYNPNVTIITITEGYGGCIADDDWFERVEEYNSEEISDIEHKLNNELPSWYGIHDRVEICRVKRPWIDE